MPNSERETEFCWSSKWREMREVVIKSLKGERERERERECERGSEGVFNRVREIEEVR